jgi:hypothetical protein
MGINYNYNSSNDDSRRSMIVAIAPPPLGEANTLPALVISLAIVLALVVIAVIAIVYHYKKQF